ncbi:MAG: hypothetical protein EDM75_15985 [Chlorobiota bacterium]|nr:MAG: hypothetical protein EDM75_15985 [Chlorobiota bacterium]
MDYKGCLERGSLFFNEQSDLKPKGTQRARRGLISHINFAISYVICILLQKIYLNTMIQSKNRIRDWTESLLAGGRYTFILDEAKKSFPDVSEDSLRASLLRLSAKGKVQSVFRGFYIIIPPQYSKMGVLPPQLFLDQLMKYLERQYYIGLLNAAQYYGSAHQSPQETFVFTEFPSMRDTQTAGIRIKYVSRALPSDKYIRQIKSEAGYLRISSPALTIIDLVQYQHRAGGINRIATVMAGMAEDDQLDVPDEGLIKATKTSVLQRLGVILDSLGLNHESGLLYERLAIRHPRIQRIALNPSKPKEGFHVDLKWNVIINTTIEPEI